MTDPLQAADNIVVARQVLAEIALDKNLSLTFLPRPSLGPSSSLTLTHRLKSRGAARLDPFIGEWQARMRDASGIVQGFSVCSINGCRWEPPPSTVPGDALTARHALPSDLNPYVTLMMIYTVVIATISHEPISSPHEVTSPYNLVPVTNQLTRAMVGHETAGHLLPETLFAAVAASREDLFGKFNKQNTTPDEVSDRELAQGFLLS